MFSTYQSQDVTILLKDITGLVTPLGTRERDPERCPLLGDAAPGV